MNKAICSGGRISPLALLCLAAVAVGWAGAARAGDVRCPKATELKSQNDATPTLITFVNTSKDPSEYVTIYWLNFQGKRVRYNDLPPGTEVTYHTYLTHPWVIAEPNWEAHMSCEEVFMPTRAHRTIAVGNYPPIQ